MFSLKPKNNGWKFYNWDKVTTVVMVEYLDMKVVCHAHKYGARAMTIGRYDMRGQYRRMSNAKREAATVAP